MKKLSLLFFTLVLGSAIIMYSCSSGGEKKAPEENTTVKEEVAPAATVDPEAAMMARGEDIYKTKCFACHQADGKGLPNAFPSLIGSEFLLNTPVMAAAQALNGSLAVPAHGTVKYPAPMPPQVDNKEDAVAVINYVMKTYNESDKRITVEDLADITIDPR
jgi:nitrite reductase (NO-forming)